MIPALAALVATGLATGPTQTIDFRVAPVLPAVGLPLPTGPTVLAPLPTRSEAPSVDEVSPPPPPTTLPRRAFSTAQGFGHQVPLHFMVRQIVPPGVAVSYDEGVRTDASVDWIGGAPWNRVLMKAIGPLGYRVVTGPRSVRIAPN